MAGSAGEVTGSDLAIALRRMPPQNFAAMIRDGRDPARYQFDGWRSDGEPDPGASELLEYGRAGIRIRVGAPDGARDRALTWAQIRGWIQAGLTPARQQLIIAAAAVHARYSALADGYALPGTPAHQALQQAARELDGIARQAIGTVISAALDRHGPGPLPRRAPGRAATDGGLLPLPAAGDATGAETAALYRVAQLASVLPGWPPRWEKPLSQVHPGDVLRRAWQGPALFIVTEPPRRAGDITELTGSAPGGQPATWLISHDRRPDPLVEMIPGTGPLTGPVPAPAAAPAASAAGPDPEAAGLPPSGPAAPAALPPGPPALPPPLRRPLALPPGGMSRQEERPHDLLEDLVPDPNDGRRRRRLAPQPRPRRPGRHHCPAA